MILKQSSDFGILSNFQKLCKARYLKITEIFLSFFLYLYLHNVYLSKIDEHNNKGIEPLQAGTCNDRNPNKFLDCISWIEEVLV